MKRAERVPELDLLRFTAASLIAIYHVCAWPHEGVPLQRLTAFGFVGVPLFFLISGFVILMSAENSTALGFAISRISRLYPTFWISVLITGGILANCGYAPSIAQLAANLTMLPENFHQKRIDVVYWTLAVEIHFYRLIWLLLLVRQLHRTETWLLLWLGGSAACLFVTGGMFFGHLSPRSLTLYPYGPLFISGCYFYLIRKNGASWRYFAPLVGSCTLAVIFICTPDNSLWWLEAYGKKWPSPYSPDALWIAGALVVCMHLVFLSLALRLWRLPESRWWYWLGGLTYPFYLLHLGLGYPLWQRLPLGPWGNVIVTVSAVLLLAWVIATQFEPRVYRPMQRLLERRVATLGRRLSALSAPKPAIAVAREPAPRPGIHGTPRKEPKRRIPLAGTTVRAGDS